MPKKISRREALKVGALGILGGLAACSPVARATQTAFPTYAPFPTDTPAAVATAAPNTSSPTNTPVATFIDDMAVRATAYLNSLDANRAQNPLMRSTTLS